MPDAKDRRIEELEARVRELEVQGVRVMTLLGALTERIGLSWGELVELDKQANRRINEKAA